MSNQNFRAVLIGAALLATALIITLQKCQDDDALINHSEITTQTVNEH